MVEDAETHWYYPNVRSEYPLSSDILCGLTSISAITSYLDPGSTTQ